MLIIELVAWKPKQKLLLQKTSCGYIVNILWLKHYAFKLVK